MGRNKNSNKRKSKRSRDDKLFLPQQPGLIFRTSSPPIKEQPTTCELLFCLSGLAGDKKSMNKMKNLKADKALSQRLLHLTSTFDSTKNAKTLCFPGSGGKYRALTGKIEDCDYEFNFDKGIRWLTVEELSNNKRRLTVYVNKFGNFHRD